MTAENTDPPANAQPREKPPRIPLRRIASVEGWPSRLALWGELFSVRGGESAAADLLDEAVRGAARRDAEATRAYLPLLDLDALTSRVGPGRLADVLHAARLGARDAALLLLEHPGAPLGPERIGPPPDPVLDTLSLGHRKTAARGPRAPLLERILKDPDPRVVAEVLRNPRLREAEVLVIASRRPSPAEVFHLLARSEPWISRPSVRAAIAQNPYAPTRLAVAMVVLLPDPLLREIAHEEGLHPGVRDGALSVLRWRSEAPGVRPG